MALRELNLDGDSQADLTIHGCVMVRPKPVASRREHESPARRTWERFFADRGLGLSRTPVFAAMTAGGEYVGPYSQRICLTEWTGGRHGGWGNPESTGGQ